MTIDRTPPTVVNPEQTEAMQQQTRSGALDLMSVIGGSTIADMGATLGIMAAMRPDSRLADAMLPQVPLHDASGDYSQVRRADRSVSRTYNTGARMDLDAAGRITSMTTPGSDPVTMRFEYQGNNRQPSAAVVSGDGKNGPIRVESGPNSMITVNTEFGGVGIASPEYSGNHTIAGRSDRVLQNGGMRTTVYDHSDRSTTTHETDMQGQPTLTRVARANGSGHTIVDGQLTQSRFAPGTNIRYDGIVGGQHNFQDVAWITPRGPNPGGGNNVALQTRDGRTYILSNVMAGPNNTNLVGAVTEKKRR